MDCKSLLKELSVYNAAAGNEKNMSLYIKQLFEKYCDKTEIDSFFNVTGFVKGLGSKAGKIMIAAHYDEIGFVVSGIDEKGFVRFSSIGGIDGKILLAQEVIIHGKSDVYGVIGAKPPHLLNPDEAKKSVKIEELAIDTGYPADKIKKMVSIGDFITLKALPLELQGNKVSSKSLDNRSGIAVLVEILSELKNMRHDSDIYVLATVQEEVGLRGAKIAAYNLQPDIAVVVDACHGDMPEVLKNETYVLGKGPAIGIGPNLHKKLTKMIVDTAKDENIPYQIDAEPGDTGTEAWAIQVSRSGIPTVLVSIPLRYMHTAIETVHVNDVKNAARLVCRFITRLEEKKGEMLCC